MSISILDILISDIIINIASFLNTFNKVKFLSLSKNLHILKDRINYDTKIKLYKICKLWYYDRFTNIIVSNSTRNYNLPKSIINLF